MRKTYLFLLVFGFLVLFPFVAKAIEQSEMDGDPMDNPNHFIWDLMAAMDTPDDTADCLTAAQNLLTSESVPTDQVTSISNSACNSLAQMRTEMESGMNQIGESIETNLWDAANWHSVQNLYFQHSSGGTVDGRIAFTVPIDFLSYNFMNFMMTFGENMESGDGILGLNADTVNGMRGYGAILTMYNVDDFEDPVILVDGESDDEGIVSNLVYDRDARTITFNAAHFTTFEVTESSAVPKLTKVRIQKYNSKRGYERLKVIIYGEHFNEDTEITIGGKSPLATSFKRSRKIVAFYNLSELSEAQKAKMKLVVTNGNDSKRYKNRLMMADLVKLKLNELKEF